MIVSIIFLFFFSSRRRHTRSLRDWSSDVCSSDLPRPENREDDGDRGADRGDQQRVDDEPDEEDDDPDREADRPQCRRRQMQIGRASCRERVESSVGGGALKKKTGGEVGSRETEAI